MSLRNDVVLPTLEDYSVLTDQELEFEIQSVQYTLHIFEVSSEPTTEVAWKIYKMRLQRAEQELERRYLLS